MCLLSRQYYIFSSGNPLPLLIRGYYVLVSVLLWINVLKSNKRIFFPSVCKELSCYWLSFLSITFTCYKTVRISPTIVSKRTAAGFNRTLLKVVKPGFLSRICSGTVCSQCLHTCMWQSVLAQDVFVDSIRLGWYKCSRSLLVVRRAILFPWLAVWLAWWVSYFWTTHTHTHQTPCPFYHTM